MFSPRLLLLPFSWIYGAVVFVRNKCFDWRLFQVHEIPGSSITVGNITVGGTGKSPHTSFLVDFLHEFNPVILSRGYGRKTKGLYIASEKDSASELGDEPYMYWKQFKQHVPVVLAEKRLLGVQWIRQHFPTALIVLDDAFQHRAVKAGLNLVLMTYDEPVFEDYPFPAGNLREGRCGMKRADIVVVTKCPFDMTPQQKMRFYNNIPIANRLIFFSEIAYTSIEGLFGEVWNHPKRILVITGIAQPEPLYRFLQANHEIETLKFPDHHDFSASDIQKIQQKVATFGYQDAVIVTTEKDAARLMHWESEFKNKHIAVFVQKMGIKIDREEDFKDLLKNYVVRANERSC